MEAVNLVLQVELYLVHLLIHQLGLLLSQGIPPFPFLLRREIGSSSPKEGWIAFGSNAWSEIRLHHWNSFILRVRGRLIEEQLFQIVIFRADSLPCFSFIRLRLRVLVRKNRCLKGEPSFLSSCWSELDFTDYALSTYKETSIKDGFGENPVLLVRDVFLL